jgi:hypothetical protein
MPARISFCAYPFAFHEYDQHFAPHFTGGKRIVRACWPFAAALHLAFGLDFWTFDTAFPCKLLVTRETVALPTRLHSFDLLASHRRGMVLALKTFIQPRTNRKTPPAIDLQRHIM